MTASGVVRIQTLSMRGSAVLLEDGRHLLTAAHVLKDASIDETRVVFDDSFWGDSARVSNIQFAPGYDPDNFQSDLALVTLAEPAPGDLTGYALDAADSLVGTNAELIGFGDRWVGRSTDFWGNPLQQTSYNRIDATSDQVGFMDNDSLLLFDYDNGSSAHDAFGALYGLSDRGLGSAEGFIGHGDSGGALLVNGQLAGILTAIDTVWTSSAMPDVDMTPNGSPGEIGVAQRLGYFQDWLKQTLTNTVISFDQAENIALLYKAALDRSPDEEGLNYWISEFEQGMQLEEIADRFIDSFEFASRFAINSDEDYIDQLYQNVLDRTPDAAGRSWWLDKLATGVSDRGDVLIGFAVSPENANNATWLSGLQHDEAGDWTLIA